MRQLTLGFSFLLLSISAWSQEARLQPFETDYCTMFVDGTPQKPSLWKHCCFEHDLRYWFGGNSFDLDFADEALRQCVQSAAGNLWANLIYKGVREGHKSPVRHRYHWSWGWSPARADTPLTPFEKALIRQELGALPLDPNYIQNFILKYQLN